MACGTTHFAHGFGGKRDARGRARPCLRAVHTQHAQAGAIAGRGKPVHGQNACAQAGACRSVRRPAGKFALRSGIVLGGMAESQLWRLFFCRGAPVHGPV